MAERAVARKSRGVPRWAWIVGSADLAGILLILFLGQHEGAAAAPTVTARDGGMALATAPK